MKKRFAALVFVLVAAGGAFGQQVSFTTRTYLQAPVIIASVADSKEYGFQSMVLRNEGHAAVTAVQFKIVFRSGEVDEVAEERRIAVNLEPNESKRVATWLGQVEGLKQMARVRRQTAGLAVITIELVEFAGGAEWRQADEQLDIPFDGVRPPK